MRPEPSGPSLGPVLLDVGGKVGAAVVYTSAGLDGREIEIRALGHDWDGTHVAVRARPVPGCSVFAAVFSGLKSGPYELRARGRVDAVVHRIDVRGAVVTECTWPEPGEAPEGDLSEGFVV